MSTKRWGSLEDISEADHLKWEWTKGCVYSLGQPLHRFS